MQRNRLVILSLTCFVLAAAAALRASDRIAVYARIDKVVLAPDDKAPQTVQIFGIFSVAKPNNPNDYDPAAKGYLFLKRADNDDLARREWADLKALAGTKQIVAFGSRWEMRAQLRSDKDKPADPDFYKTGTGVTKVNDRTDYAPIRAIIDFKE